MRWVAGCALFFLAACTASQVSERDVGAADIGVLDDAALRGPPDGGRVSPPDAGPVQWPDGGGVPTSCGAADGTLLRSGTAGLFGWSVALTPDGSRAIVGAIQDGGVGAAYVFRCDSGLWEREARLVGMGIAAAAELGRSVALSTDGAIALVGAVLDQSEPDRADGSVRVYARVGTSWTEEARLFPEGSTYGSMVGYAVALSADGTVALVGRPNHDEPRGESVGSAHVYRRTSAGWTEEAVLVADPPGYQAAFGVAVALSADGSVALIGAGGDDAPGTNDNRGSARILRRDGRGWREEAVFTSGEPMDWFGTSVSLSADGTRAAVGSANDDTADGEETGSVRVFVLDAGAWREEAVLVPPGALGTGVSVALSAEARVLVASSNIDVLHADGPGRLHVFVRAGTTWAWAGTHVGEVSESFAFSAAITADGSHALVGAPSNDIRPGELSGAATWLRLAP